MRTSDQKEIREAILNHWGTDRVWSFSQINNYVQDPFAFFLQYIKKVPKDKNDTDAYGIYGNMVHTIMEKYYKGELSSSDCVKEFEQNWNKLSMLGLNFSNNDADQDAKLKSRYHADICHFFNHFETIEGNNECERPVAVLLEDGEQKEAFMGFLDFMNIDTDKDGHKKYNIIDYKTSTIYKGEAIYEHSKQLILYAIGVLHNENAQPQDISIAWNFLKYATVTEEQKNGNMKDRVAERYKLVETLEVSIKRWLKTFKYSDTDIMNIYTKCAMNNTFDYLPDDVKSKFIVKDCIVHIDFTPEMIETVTKDLISKCAEIRKKTDEYNLNHDESIFYWEPTKQDEFYYYNLCPYSRTLHIPFDKYFKTIEEQNQYDPNAGSKADDDLLGEFLKGITN